MTNNKTQYTLTQLANVTNIPRGTLRNWLKTPIVGQPYNPNFLNYDRYDQMISRYFDNDKFTSAQIEIIEYRGLGGQSVNIVEQIINGQLETETPIIFCNYHQKRNWIYMESIQIKTAVTLIIFLDEKGVYHSYTIEQLSQPQVKVLLRDTDSDNE